MFTWNQRTSTKDKAHIEQAIKNATPIPGIKGWVTGSWEGSVRPISGKWKGVSMNLQEAIKHGFPPMGEFQLFYLIPRE